MSECNCKSCKPESRYNWPRAFINLTDWAGLVVLILILASCVSGHRVL